MKINSTTIRNFIPVMAFIAPISILYYLHPTSFNMTWKGRTYYLFFIWLLALETVLDWKKTETEWKVKSPRTLFLLGASALPTAYIVLSECTSLDTFIISFFQKHLVEKPLVEMMPLAIEYLVFTTSLVLIVLVGQSMETLPKYSISIFFLGILGLVYLVDNLYPYGKFTPFQMVVPTTTQLAANILNTMGFKTAIFNIQNPTYGSITILRVFDAQGKLLAGFGIGWPCAGVDSLLLYSVTVLLFLKNSGFSLKISVACFFIGAAVTYFINILRIVSIYLIAINGGDWGRFHDYYGPLFSITWITLYPLIVLVSQQLWRKIAKKG
ncbi:MAG: exosortase/archaeosortase family protein [Candidatus Bathyarchaeia archaeon]